MFSTHSSLYHSSIFSLLPGSLLSDRNVWDAAAQHCPKGSPSSPHQLFYLPGAETVSQKEIHVSDYAAAVLPSSDRSSPEMLRLGRITSSLSVTSHRLTIQVTKSHVSKIGSPPLAIYFKPWEETLSHGCINEGNQATHVGKASPQHDNAVIYIASVFLSSIS